MGQRQETHRQILVRHLRDTNVMCTHRLQVVGMCQHNALGIAGRTGCIDNGSDVFRRSLTCTDLDRTLGMGIVTQPDEIVEIDRLFVFGIQPDRRIENDEPLQNIRQLALYNQSIVILLLLAHKERMYLCVLDNVGNLLRRTGCIHRHIGNAVAIRTKIGKQTLGHILRIDTNILLHTDAIFRHSLGCQVNFFRELAPRDL